jgi:hypothetical protein
MIQITLNSEEEHFRKKIRKDLLAKHKKKKEKNPEKKKPPSQSEISVSNETLKKYLRRNIENKLYAAHPKFIKCTNHLGEIKWLIQEELTDQYEFYPIEDTKWERIRNKFFPKRVKKTPAYDWIDDYKNKVETEISSEIKKRLKRVEKIKQKKGEERKVSRKQDIIAQEKEVFYRSHPDYKLYRNYAGETRWLTREEFENQDEFFEQVKTTREKIFSYPTWIAIIFGIIAITILYLTFFINNSPEKGYLFIETNETYGQLYINENLVLGFNPDKPLLLNKGEYQVFFHKAGFKTTPSSRKINIVRKDTLKIKFDLAPIDITNQAIVFIKSNLKDAKIFIDNSFYGTTKTNPHILLNPGKYTIALNKSGYDAMPLIQEIEVNHGDTLHLSFKFVPRGNINGQSYAAHNGLIEVTSNVQGAKIIYDNKETEYTTNYILNKIPFGRHIISLDKEGYKINPPNRQVFLNEKNQHVKINFELSRTMLPVHIKTEPVEGTIYMDNKEIGRGDWQGELTLGEHNIRFGKIEYYQEPDPKKIILSEDGPTNFTFLYQLNFHIIFTPNKILPNNNIGGIQLGYLSDDETFTSDPKNGPEITNLPTEIDSENHGGDSIWKLGYAFKYRNPPENDAILFSFIIPKKIDLKNDIYLKIWGYNTEEKYPLEISGKSKIQIAINNKIIQNKYTPKFSIKEANESNYEQFLINNLLTYGKNTVRVATNTGNSTFYVIRKVTIE